jgi:hypothetical protein
LLDQVARLERKDNCQWVQLWRKWLRKATRRDARKRKQGVSPIVISSCCTFPFAVVESPE